MCFIGYHQIEAREHRRDTVKRTDARADAITPRDPSIRDAGTCAVSAGAA
jgi:hypothetical protein